MVVYHIGRPDVEEKEVLLDLAAKFQRWRSRLYEAYAVGETIAEDLILEVLPRQERERPEAARFVGWLVQSGNVTPVAHDTGVDDKPLFKIRALGGVPAEGMIMTSAPVPVREAVEQVLMTDLFFLTADEAQRLASLFETGEEGTVFRSSVILGSAFFNTLKRLGFLMEGTGNRGLASIDVDLNKCARTYFKVSPNEVGRGRNRSWFLGDDSPHRALVHTTRWLEILREQAAPATTITEPEPTITEPEPTITEPEPTITEPEPTITEPEPTITEPEPVDELTTLENRLASCRNVYEGEVAREESLLQQLQALQEVNRQREREILELEAAISAERTAREERAQKRRELEERQRQLQEQLAQLQSQLDELG